MSKTFVLEKSTNTHTLQGNVVNHVDYNATTTFLNIEGQGVVSHGEHGTVITESSKVFKNVQFEFNPVQRKMVAAFD